ncbi:hypothetical protein D8B26_000504 [Coccidioides posadasii str. Silveira]|uniref:Uncharacterized protein n=3 Tax=Coccidioides posadasii TaxID=199306 RepID=E9DFI0_COCPS|nr:bZIP family transcription factor [Coccidioides posadasii C735 delta SOWgp]EER29218.1 bZIP family transcription factor [Coccidioides posadasii C735 delta SOWgp]EFW14837.1 hypothetical protein CPSG_08495 [Coccidioides posadasii str. Silveira]KMM70505.1 hypothetical protein CPAG_06816 [Coccidioides posadasii RMSCC 3488]QVM05796.1 hypothetical protein D8B26_000504 [Coccidioides posadasii str. Silveira]|eukprot:XP_003071363.1 bZIP family transcription factor [Coccidioides posadasii C735 delta SOWgp]
MPAWAQFPNVDSGGSLGGQFMPNTEVSGPSVDRSSALKHPAAVADANGLIKSRESYHNFNPKFAVDFQNGYFPNNGPVPSSTSYDYSLSLLSLSCQPQQVKAHQSLSTEVPVQTAALSVSFDTPQHNSGSSTSSTTQSPPDCVSRTSSSRRKKPRLDSSDPADAAADRRRRNTLAARRFRQRQHDRISQLEQALEQVAKERDELKVQVAKWEGEATALRGMLGKRSGGSSGLG